jgi:hypothetical protein
VFTTNQQGQAIFKPSAFLSINMVSLEALHALSSSGAAAAATVFRVDRRGRRVKRYIMESRPCIKVLLWSSRCHSCVTVTVAGVLWLAALEELRWQVLGLILQAAAAARAADSIEHLRSTGSRHMYACTARRRSSMVSYAAGIA